MLPRMRPPVLPNVITAIRLPLAPIAVGCLVTGTVWGTITAAVLAILLEVTDLADGYYARKYHHVTNFGKLFDPFADAFCRFTLFLGLFAIGAADLWMILIIFYRDSSVSFFRSIAATRDFVLAARKSGKIKALTQGIGTQVAFLALVVHELYPDLPHVAEVPWWTMLVITVVTAGSFLDYFLGNYALLHSAWTAEPSA